MTVTPALIQSFTGDALTGFYLDEYRHETAGEQKRFNQLVCNGADFWMNRIKADNELFNSAKGGNIQVYHRFCPIPQSHIDNVNPKDPNPQNFGYE